MMPPGGMPNIDSDDPHHQEMMKSMAAMNMFI
jgi:hypothetical protein